MKDIKISLFRAFAVISAVLIVSMPGIVSADSGSGDSGGSDNNSSSSSSGGSDKQSSDSGSSSSSGSSDSSSSSSGDKGSGSSTDKNSTESSGSSDKTPQNTEHETEVQIEDANSKDGQQYVNGLTNGQNTHSASDRAKNCQAAQHGLETMLKNLQTNATNFDSRINTVYTQALAYQKSSGNTPTGFSTLVANATAAQLKAQAAVTALGSLSVNLNCSSSTVATNVAVFRAATAQARTYLVAYQTAVNKVLVALGA